MTISVIIPAYNNERYLGRAIDSVLAQSRPADEIIVVDDGSTDRTAEVAQTYGEKIRCIRQDNRGPGAARNTGIRAASGEWIAFLDADDEWLPDKLAVQTDLLRRHPQLQWTCGNYIECLCESGRQAPALPEQRILAVLNGGQISPDYLKTYAKDLTGHTDTMLIRRNLLEKAGLFRPEQKRFNDLDLWLRIAYLEPPIGYIAQPLAVHHLQAGEHISVRFHSPHLFRELISRHLHLSAEHHRLDAFRPLAVFLLRRWMRALLFDPSQAREIRRLLNDFAALLPVCVRLQYTLLTVFPSLTAVGCRGLSFVVRKMGLRRRVVRKPPPLSGYTRYD
ncbi:MAG TPA: glycosyltransferase family A protein [Anaerohalosphaeraceae bacterium]|nr:glycosyltransferase family A protein [Anaerohalosphaeraceae bacterium]HOL88536.1 glycosyltransferase family A protein [Anaerohalosphaeraceae bacterium]HPP56410.1 glycosyltransferase family A protein [Anaerohalosphaeraceae bacterium]